MMSRLRKLASDKSIYFIAEIGQNHQGQLKIAKQMVDSLVGVGVSAIKTAKRDIDKSLTQEQKETPYNNPHSFGATYYEHRKALELSKDDFRELKIYSESRGFDFISSFTDTNSLDFLVDIGVEYLKIASQRMWDKKLLEAAAVTRLPTIISTGMCNLDDVDRAVEVFSESEKYLLQCTSVYPCDEHLLNLNIISTYQRRYGSLVDGYGFSGHHGGVAPDILAYILGATIIERHYTLHRYWKGSDHSASLEKTGVERVLRYIDQVRMSYGSHDKSILPEEQLTIKKLRADLH